MQQWERLAARVLAWSMTSTLSDARERARGDLAAKLVLGMSAVGMELPNMVYLSPDGEILISGRAD